jgi:hypothetical protein
MRESGRRPWDIDGGSGEDRSAGGKDSGAYFSGLLPIGYLIISTEQSLSKAFALFVFFILTFQLCKLSLTAYIYPKIPLKL